MFWKVAGFSQPSPIEQILDQDEFTLEELLDEDDIIQECKSLNGRLVAFLRERSTVEQLVRYLVDPPLDADDPKRAYKYPFTSCEVFCCEVEAVFNTLLEDPQLMHLLFSLLDAPPPLSSKTAGYFGRVVGHLLLRKTNEFMQYLQEHPQLLERLVQHVDTTSIAEILKRLVGADEQSSVLFLAEYATWLAETPLAELLLANLDQGKSADAQANAADILCAIAHTQPSPLASKLTEQQGISALFTHALAPGQQVLVPALDVCIALIEPRRSQQAMEDAPMQDAAMRAKVAAVEAIVPYIPSLTQLLQAPTVSPLTGAVTVQETPYGLLSPTLGRARLKAVELLAVLLRSSSLVVETAVIQTGAVKFCLQLFASYPFNNLLHHCVVAMLVAILTKSSPTMLKYIFEECQLLEWIINLPTDICPTPIPGQEELAANKPLIRAGYMGHVTQIASTLESFSSHAHDTQGEEEAEARQQGISAEEETGAARYLESSQAWQTYLLEVLHPRQDLENTARWVCGRPTATELAGLDSDGDEFQAEMELEHMVGMQPVLYHRYHVDENEEDEDGDDDDDDEAHTLLKPSAYETQAVTDAMGNIDLNDSHLWQEQENLPFGQLKHFGEDIHGVQGLATQLSSSSRQTGMEDDEVLLATSDEEDQTHRTDAMTSAGPMQSSDEAIMADQPMAMNFPPPPSQRPDVVSYDLGAMTWQPGVPAAPS